jgi:hypothetical protein
MARIRIRIKQRDPYQIEKQDPDPYKGEKQDPDPHQKGLDPQHCPPYPNKRYLTKKREEIRFDLARAAGRWGKLAEENFHLSKKNLKKLISHAGLVTTPYTFHDRW